MSANTVLLIIGILLILVGVAKLGSGTGGFSLKNIGLNIGGTSTQTNRVGNVRSGPATVKNKPDWVGLAIAAIGLVTALVGLLKG
jgi:hypothetical protein